MLNILNDVINLAISSGSFAVKTNFLAKKYPFFLIIKKINNYSVVLKIIFYIRFASHL